MSNIDESKRLLKKFFSETPKEEIKAMVDKVNRENPSDNNDTGTWKTIIADVKPISVAFSEWIRYNSFESGTENRWFTLYNASYKDDYTTAELFDIFIKQYNP